jgi:tRNA(fMet)-specific endonuclease VapC
VLIAGQAVARNMILVTRNRNEFERVPGMRVEDWEE